MNKLKLILVGNASLTQQCGVLALAQGHSIVAVVTQDGQVRDWALGLGLRVETQQAGWPHRLHDIAADWLLSVANLHMIPAAALAHMACGAVNFHDGPLPRYAGLNAPVWALLQGAVQHGITWHLIDAGVDTGDILEQRLFQIAADDTALTLNTRCFEAALDSFPSLLAQLETGELRRNPQDMTHRSVFRSADRPAAMGRIDFAQSTTQVLRLIRALDHGSYWNPLTTAKLSLAGQVVSVGQGQLAPGAGAPGQILRADANGLVVACADGAVALSELRSPDGILVAPEAVVATAVDGLTASESQSLTALGQATAAQDAAARRALKALQPVTLPMTVQTTAAPNWQRLDLDPALTLPALGLAALRICGMAQGDIAVAAHSTPGYASDWIALRIDGQTPVAEALAGLQHGLAHAKSHPGFALDLRLRDPALATQRMPELGLSDFGPILATLATLTPGCLHYDAARLPPAQASAYAARLCEIAAAAMQAGDRPLVSLPRLTAVERDQVLHQFNATQAASDCDLCVHQGFERQVRATPDAIALICENVVLTYAALEARANQLAHVLAALGAAPGVLIGLCLPRGPDMVAAALAIMKAGAAYVPMDPSYPADRIALFIADSGCAVIVTDAQTAAQLPPQACPLLCVDQDLRIAAAPDSPPHNAVTPADLAYVIYTSGSTGRPKGVMVEHRNVMNFFAGMDQRLGAEPGTWLALTSLSFDISVLELFWTLSRGYKLVLTSEANRALVASDRITPQTEMAFSLYFWGNDDAAGAGKYDLLLDAARFADTAGFCAVWTPERHFHAFGGPYPNPAVTGAAVAAVTRNIGVRAGSCVAPLHHPLRIAEDWAVVDNLCDGRAGLALASGWHPDDFVLRPENTPPHNRAALFETARQLRSLWRGETVEFPRADGSLLAVKSQPRPISKEVPLWITTAGNPETWAEAGRLGANLLTHLLGQTIDEVAEKIAVYHQALRRAGHNPQEFTVTLMLHSYVAATRDAARAVARAPMKAYLRAAASLIKSYAWAFPAFKKPKGVTKPADIDIEGLAPEELEAILDHAFERYFDESGLFGTVEDALARVDQLRRIGVGEVACLIDYGIAPDVVLQGLPALAEVLRRANLKTPLPPDDHSIAAEIHRHKVTHLQCTPSMARMLAGDDTARVALRGLQSLLLGGEALPQALADDLIAATPAQILNMYGPTETTIWSACAEVTKNAPIVLGKPLANQMIYVLDDDMAPLPAQSLGEIWIGGKGVARGYWRQPELTADRFVKDMFSEDGAARLYRTGDLGRWRADGQLEFLGRTDSQIKLRGFRIELGEIETAISIQPGVAQAVVLLREDNDGDARLVAYINGSATESALRQALALTLPTHMRPAHYVSVSAFPLTPNQKIDRKALSALRPVTVTAPQNETVQAAPQTDLEQRIADQWRKVLGLAVVQPEDNFFALGGHSLLAVQLHRELRTQLDLPSLSITDIFRFPTLRGLASHLAPKPVPAADPSPLAASRADLMARRRAMRAGGLDG